MRVDLGLVVRAGIAAGWLDPSPPSSSGISLEPGFDVELEHLGIEVGKGRLRREVDEGVLGRRERLASPPGPGRKRIPLERTWPGGSPGKTTGSKQ